MSVDIKYFSVFPGSTGTAADGGAGGPEVHRAGAVPAAGPGAGGHVRSAGGRSGGREASQTGRGGRPQAAGTVSQQTAEDKNTSFNALWLNVSV